MTSHRDARVLATAGFAARFGREPTRPEVQCLQAVGRLETNYGDGWHGAGAGSFNMGAITGAGPTGKFFIAKDSYPDEKGVNHWYETRFSAYDNAADGWSDLARVVLQIAGRSKRVLPAATRGDTLGFSAGLFDTKYYLGFGKSRDERIANHHRAVVNACAAMARELGEPMPDGSEPPRVVRTLRQGMTDIAILGSPIATMQRIVGAPVEDGVFGEATKAAVIAWQEQRHLKPDGVFGPVCYDTAIRELDGETIDALYGYESP